MMEPSYVVHFVEKLMEVELLVLRVAEGAVGTAAGIVDNGFVKVVEGAELEVAEMDVG
jgi:hypothetical protein